MVAFYRRLLRLYPIEYFREYADEMTFVFRQAHEAMRRKSPRMRAAFFWREVYGVITGALRARICRQDWNCLWRFEMRAEYRFPRTTILMMLLVLFGIGLAIE